MCFIAVFCTSFARPHNGEGSGGSSVHSYTFRATRVVFGVISLNAHKMTRITGYDLSIAS